MRRRKKSHVSHGMSHAVLVWLVLTTAMADAQQISPFAQCVSVEVVNLDDGRSDARTVASAVLLRCRKAKIEELKARLSDAERALPGADKEIGAMVDEQREDGLAWVSGVVLGVRARRER